MKVCKIKTSSENVLIQCLSKRDKYTKRKERGLDLFDQMMIKEWRRKTRSNIQHRRQRTTDVDCFLFFNNEKQTNDNWPPTLYRKSVAIKNKSQKRRRTIECRIKIVALILESNESKHKHTLWERERER